MARPTIGYGEVGTAPVAVVDAYAYCPAAVVSSVGMGRISPTGAANRRRGGPRWYASSKMQQIIVTAGT